MNELHTSVGTLRYSNHSYWMVVDIDQGIMDFYQSLIPKYIKYNKPLYPAHISVVRKETPTITEPWLKHQGEKIEFRYSPIIHSGELYIWLNVYCKRLEDIRRELGLPVHSWVTNPPAPGFEQCFHSTIGNFKDEKTKEK